MDTQCNAGHNGEPKCVPFKQEQIASR